MADISQVKLPDGTTYNLKDSYVRTNYRALNNNDFDTINVTELNAGDLIVTGAARFLNTINGNISGNSATATSATSATKATQDSDGNAINTTYLKKSGGTMTGQIVLASNGYKTNSTSGYSADQYGNFTHLGTTTSDYWMLKSNNGTNKFSVYWETGNVTAAGNVTAPKFIGALQGDADTWDGYHCYYDRYKYTYEFTQPTADTIWYVKIATANWNSNLEIIQIRTEGNNKTGSHVLHTGSRGTSWWGYGQSYGHRGVIGVRKSIGNADNVYLKLEASCTRCKIYTSFEASAAEIVTDTSTSYTTTPENGGFYGNVVTADEFVGNATSATTASKLGSSNVGSATQPIYLSVGTATACTYTLGKSVPSDAVFTDHYDWADITNKPITFITNSGALATNGWKTLGGRSSGNKIAISYASSSPATWNSESYSASIVFGCNDTKGLVDCGYNSPIVTFGGASVNGATDDAPKWYFKITGTSATTYNLNNITNGNARDNTKVAKTGDTMTGCLSITSANTSWAEGIRINRGNGGYCSFVMGGAANSTSGTGDNVWWLGCNPSSYSHKWFVAHNGSTQTGTYFYVDSASQQSPHFRVGGDLAVGSKTTMSKTCTLRYNDSTLSLDFIFTT